MNSRIAKVALVLGLVAAGSIATAVGVRVYRYHFEGRGKDGAYHFSREPEVLYESAETGVTVSRGGGVTIGSNDPNLDVEQMQKDLEEVAILRQADERELLGVVDTEVNGHLHRTLRYKYTLSDGRTHTTGEGDPSGRVERTPEQIEKDHEEVARLREQGKRELVEVIDTLVEDALDRTCIFEYRLADGRTLRVGEGDPELPPVNSLESERTHEVWKLRRLKQGEYLGYSERDVHGRTFTFETYIVTLSDGTVVTHAVGKAKDFKTSLTPADWEEFRSLREAGAGEDLGTYEEEIRGIPFVFERTLYILSDGTEFVWSYGAPKID